MTLHHRTWVLFLLLYYIIYDIGVRIGTRLYLSLISFLVLFRLVPIHIILLLHVECTYGILFVRFLLDVRLQISYNIHSRYRVSVPVYDIILCIFRFYILSSRVYRVKGAVE